MRKDLAAEWQPLSFFWHLSTYIRTFHIRVLEKDSIGVYNYVGGVKWIFRLLNI